jgi:hypothetical protein
MGAKERNTLKVAALKAGESVAARNGRAHVKYLPLFTAVKMVIGHDVVWR